MHRQIRASGNLPVGGPQRLGITGAKLLAEILACDEGRVTDDEIRFRPLRRLPLRTEWDGVKAAAVAEEQAGRREQAASVLPSGSW
jgi:hypothetical protein